MRVHRHKQEFIGIETQVLLDPHLSLSAKGLYALLLATDGNDALARLLPEFAKAMTELRDRGLVEPMHET